VYRDKTPQLFLNGKPACTGIRSSYEVHSGVGVQHRRGVAPFRGSVGKLQAWDRALTEAEIVQIMRTTPIPRLLPEIPTAEVLRSAEGRLMARVWEPGEYAAYSGHGRTWRFGAGQLPSPLELSGPWQLRLAPQGGAPTEVNLERLISWSDHPDSAVKYYSGTATYTKSFEIPAAMPAKNRRLFLDMGEVQVMAEVKLNGRNLGTLWKPPFRIDITEAAQAGTNTLEIKVVNLWPNRMVGDEQLPEDSDRNADGTLRQWPGWLQAGRPSPTGRETFATWRLWKKNDPLLRSGLLGPVRVLCANEIPLGK
jgi:hypothetical protein